MRILRLRKEKGSERMLAAKAQNTAEVDDTAKLEFYRLIGEGYKAMQDGRTSTIEEVREKIDQRRKWKNILKRGI